MKSNLKYFPKFFPVFSICSFAIVFFPAYADKNKSLPISPENNSSSCHGLLNAVSKVPPGSVAWQRIIEKLYARGCGDDVDEDSLLSFEETLIYHTDPDNPDTDGDLLTDGEEVQRYFTDPRLADTDEDELPDGEEVLTYLTNPLEKDTDLDNLEDGVEVLTTLTNPINPDTDSDAISDGDEVMSYLTNPLDKDTDGDALEDGWEILGHPNGTLLIDADPRRKDIYVEMDFMSRASAANGLGPSAYVLSKIEDVFDNAPVSNPDGSTGITIHLEIGNEVPFDENLYPVESEFNAIKAVHFDPAKSPVYHYMVWANAFDNGSWSGISFGIPASDFIVSLGRWENGNGGTDEHKIGTFIHEIGHNLGLKHGGNDHTNYKPNYVSVMNYSFQVVGIDSPTGKVFDYQRFDLPMIDEANLVEADGISSDSQWSGYQTFYYCANTYTRKSSPLNVVDWDCDGNPISTVRGDVNRDRWISQLGTQNNWQNIVFDGGAVGVGVIEKSITDAEVVTTEQLLSEEFEPELSWDMYTKQK
ncbi:hypothetical protein [Aestuariibacter salexigens]|uniref:hypothetical protein n=1 Tax=Aestuariibacter salexigens TaxID=226010 RepID=UPI00041F1AC2|nr:hypothetical protein [Aestuariibacter salexigens]